MNLQQMLFSTRGRIRRRDYWIWGTVTLIAYFLLCLIVIIVLGLNGVDIENDDAIMNLVVYGVMPPYLWTNIALVAKRWHDRDKSGWMYLIALIPLVGGIWQLVECGFMEGTEGPNKYGPSPKGIGDQSRVF
jgi:uncharacterized membrane protein YhaH (DUF805 family)